MSDPEEEKEPVSLFATDKTDIHKDSDLLVPDDELDALLDDALKDFEKPVDKKVEPKIKTESNNKKAKENNESTPDPDDHLFEMTNNLTDVLEKMVMDEPSLKAQFESFQQQMDASSNAFSGGCPDLFDVDADMAKKLEELTKNFDDGGEFENMMKQMQSDMEGASGDFQGEGEGFMAMMKGMMQNLLSKDLLYPSLKDIESKYPDWLRDNKSKIGNQEYEKYSKQHKIVCQICLLFEEEKETDSDSVKNERTAKIVSLMEQMQEYGHPPSDMMENVVCGNSESSAPPECNLM